MAAVTVSLSSPRWSLCKSATVSSSSSSSSTSSTSLHPPLHRAWKRSFPSLQIRRGRPYWEAIRVVRAAVEAEEAAAVPEGGEGEEGQPQPQPQPQPQAEAEAEAEATDPSNEQQPVSVPVSPSDKLLMYFKAEGTMSESVGNAVADALEGMESIIDYNVRISEGIATVVLTKETTVQATGVASNLVETIQGLGFKLQSLSLSFEDEEDGANRFLTLEPTDEWE